MAVSLNVVGRSVPSLTAREKVTGSTIFGTDFKLPGMVYGKVLRSPIPHGKIVHIDTSRAKALPGVVAVITGKDFELPRYTVAGQTLNDQQALAVDEVHYIGDEVCAVAAVDEDTAEEALDLIRVEYEELPAVFDPEEAMQPGAPLVHPEIGTNVAYSLRVERGEFDRAVAEADEVVEGRFETQLAHQAYLEPQGCVARWDSPSKLTMWIPTQSPTLCRMTYAKALGISPANLRVIQLPVGGGFGAKIEYKLHPICALLAKASGRPVRLTNSRRDEFIAGTPRVPMIINIKLAAKRDGTLVAKQMKIVADNGAYTYYAPPILVSAATRHDCLYRLRNVRTEGYLVYTNKISTNCFRGFGNPQSHFAMESAMDMLAEALDMDPLELRLKNATRAGDVTVHGWKIESCALDECLKRAAEAVSWETRRKGFRRGAEGCEGHRGKKYRGVGIACCLHVSGNRSFLPFFDGASAIVKVDEEAHVTVYVGEVDLGQGLRTTLAQIAAEELGVAPEQVEVALVDTDISPHGLGTYADRSTTLAGNAVRLAAADARKQLIKVAAEVLEAREEDIQVRNGSLMVVGSPDRSISVEEAARIASYARAGGLVEGRGSFVPQGVTMIDPDTKYGNISCAYPFAAQAAEVEVDVETGEVTVLKLAAAHDLGKAINPLACEGQIEGGSTQGIGYALTEEIVTENGKVRNASFKRYDVPRATDIPEFVPILIESNDPNGPYGAKGLAEPALNATAAAIANAIYDAVGIRLTKLPMTPERVLASLGRSARRGCPKD